MKAPHVLTSRELLIYLTGLGIVRQEIEVRDDTFACVDRAHMLGDHYESVAQLLFSLGLTEWEDDWDCEDFTMTYVWWAIIAHRNAQRARRQFFANTPAVFECWVAGISHAIGMCVEWDAVAAAPRHFFVEPQPKAARRELDLSGRDIISISLIK